jgi:hypothetical protein
VTSGTCYLDGSWTTSLYSRPCRRPTPRQDPERSRGGDAGRDESTLAPPPCQGGSACSEQISIHDRTGRLLVRLVRSYCIPLRVVVTTT